MSRLLEESGEERKPVVDIEPRWLVDALMLLQYEFPLEPDPYRVVAERVGVSEEQLLEGLRRLNREGLLKRVGFYLNYRSERKKAALIALRTDKPREATEYLARRLVVTHSYLRSHPVYNLWVVGKHQDPEEIVEAAKSAAELYGDGRWIVLWGVKTHRLSVKYDLYEGVSRAGPYGRVEANPPTPEDLGYSMQLARSLRVLPLEPEPYAVIARRLGLPAGKVYEAAVEMFKHGVLADPGAALDGHRLGFKYNAMFTLAPKDMGMLKELCKWVVDNVPEATHVVERSVTPEGAWRHLCYFMFHAVSEDKASIARRRLASCPLLDDVLVIPSIADMLPGVIR